MKRSASGEKCHEYRLFDSQITAVAGNPFWCGIRLIGGRCLHLSPQAKAATRQRYSLARSELRRGKSAALPHRGRPVHQCSLPSPNRLVFARLPETFDSPAEGVYNQESLGFAEWAVRGELAWRRCNEDD